MIRTAHVATTAAFVQMIIGGALCATVGCGGSDPQAQSPADATGSADAGLTSLTNDKHEAKQAVAGAKASQDMTLQPAGSPTGDAIETGLQKAAATGAPGMTAEGPLGRADLKEGGHASMNVSLKAGRCYAVIGFGSGITDLDLHVLTPPNYDVVAYEDQSDDNSPVAGKIPHAICPSATVDLPYKVDVSADKGAGQVGVQLYSKAQ